MNLKELPVSIGNMDTLRTFLPLESEAEMEGHHEEGRVTSARQVPSPRWPLGLHSEDLVDLLQG